MKPLEFEPNFQKYFKHGEQIIKSNEFRIFEDKNQKRLKLIDKFEIASIGDKLVQFFGQSGNGKTLTIIGYLKYMTYHPSVGTLYINCKAMSDFDEPFKIKQLFIDEIPFLFYNNYKGYINCVNSIIDYLFLEKSSNFFDLLNHIIDIVMKDDRKKSYYIIALDQYNDKIDKGENLNKLYEELILNKNNKNRNSIIGLLTLSSMDNEETRKYKIEYLFDEEEGSKYIKNRYIEEIENLENKLTIDNGGIYDENLKKLGYGFKYYNILNNFYSKGKMESMLDYMDKIENRIRINY